MHQTKKLNRLLCLLIPVTIALMIKDSLLKASRLFFAQHLIVLLIQFIYIGLRYRYPNNNRFYEWVVISTFLVMTVCSVLINTKVMPKSLTGRNPDSQFPDYIYSMYYIAFSAFSILKIEKFLFIIVPLELISDYFLLRFT